MKWTVGQLRKLPVEYPFSFLLDFTEDIKSVEDIIALPEVEVKGTITRINLDLFQLDFYIDAKLVLACARTLEPVDYEMHLHMIEKHHTIQEGGTEEFTIMNNMIDLREITWSIILINKPMRVIHENADEILKEQGIIYLDYNPDNVENDF